jgi:hypothetical protein
MSVRGITTMLLLAAFLLAPGGADDVHAQAVTAERLKEHAAAVRERLDLTDEQVAEIRPLMEERNRRFAEIRERYAADDSRQARRDMAKEARAVQQDYETAVEPILTGEQVAEWREMQNEMRAAMKERRKETK